MMIFAGSVQASTTVDGDVNSTVAEGEIVTIWLDEDPSDYVTTAVRDYDSPDYFFFDDVNPLLDRHGYGPGSTNIPATVSMFCSGEKININQEPEGPYNNVYRNVTQLDYLLDFDIDPPVKTIELELCVADESFSKTLYAGWNLISLPLDPDDSSVSVVLSTVHYDAVYSYNATSKKYETADVMDPGTGYFVNATEDCEWAYSGDACTPIDVPLEQGLNMVGWLNDSNDNIGDALSSISGKYHYVARWNTSAEKFEVYNPSAPEPSVFNDFTTMDRGIGYFISAKQGCAII